VHAAVLHATGEPPRFEEFPEPAAAGEEALVHVRAAALKPVDRQLASGAHYASPRKFPAVCGTDGVGLLEDGTRVFFGGCRWPYGTMAQRTVAPRAFCFPVPDGVDDLTAAALPNPGVSAWLTLTSRVKLVAGETILILGATGVAGRLAVQFAKSLGAGRVIAAGRDEPALESLRALGADAVIPLHRPDQEVMEAFAHHAANSGLHVIVDYLWGHPTELLLAALTRKEFAAFNSEIRLVQVGESAGAAIALPAAALRSAPICILGTGGIPSLESLTAAFREVLAQAARGSLRVSTEPVPLADVEQAWQREVRGGHRLVLIP